MYAKSMKDDYTLADAFHAVGIRLFGPEWSGYEVWGEAAEDLRPVYEQRKVLAEKAEAVSRHWNAALKAQKKAMTPDDLHNASNDVRNFNRERNEIWAELHKLPEVRDSQIEDHGRWERYQAALGALIHGLINELIYVYFPLGMRVPPQLWLDQPDDFGFDLERSLIIWPSRHCAQQVTSARLNKDIFDSWLSAVKPLVDHEESQLTEEEKAYLWFKEQVANWDGVTKKGQFREMAVTQYAVSGRCFDERIWGLLASDDMKGPGPRKGA